MNRTGVFGVTLCVILIAAVGGSVVAAKQDSNPWQAGASSVYIYDVSATDAHGTGRLVINLEEQTFVFNGKNFTPSAQVALKAKAASSADYVIFATGKATPSGNLHVEGTWEAGAAAEPASEGFGIVAAAVYPGTIQRPSGEPCYTLNATDAYGTFTSKLPADKITYAEGGHALPNVIDPPAAVDFVYDVTSYSLSFRYQDVYYTSPRYATCPYETIVPILTGTYKPIRVWDSDNRWYEWKWYVQSSLSWNTPTEGPYPTKAANTIYYTIWSGPTFLAGVELWPAPGYPARSPLNVDSSWLSTGCGYCNCDFPLCDDARDYSPYTAVGTVWDSWGNAHSVTATLTRA